VETIVVLKDIPYSEAKNKIEDYLKSHETAYMYEVSNDLGLDLKMVHEIVEQLIKEGKVVFLNSALPKLKCASINLQELRGH